MEAVEWTKRKASACEQLCNAVQNGDVKKVSSILKEQDIDPNENYDYVHTPPLMMACRNQKLEIVKLLITNERFPANPNKREQGTSPFMVAESMKNMDLITLFLTESRVAVGLNYVHIKQDREYETTPLISAINDNNVPLIEMFLRAGANPNLGCNGYTTSCSPLIAAVEQNNVSAISLLLKAGTISSMKHEELARVLRLTVSMGNVQILRILLRSADVSIDRTLLERAIQRKRPNILDHLMRHEYNQIGDGVHWTSHLLPYAVNNGAQSCLAVLLYWGV